jgi:hypothetical protein
LLSSSGFNFNLRRYIMEWLDAHPGIAKSIAANGRAVQADSINTCVESAYGFSASS